VDDGPPSSSHGKRGARRTDGADDEESDNTDEDDDELKDDHQSLGTSTTAVAEEVAEGELDISYHYASRVSVDDEQIRFRLHCPSGAPPLVVALFWPEPAAASSRVSCGPAGLGVTLAYHARSPSDRSLAIRATQIVERNRRKRWNRSALCKRQRTAASDGEPASDTSGVVAAVSSDEDEEEESDGMSPAASDIGGRAGGDPYLQSLQRVANIAFRSLPIDAAIERVVSKAKDLLNDADNGDNDFRTRAMDASAMRSR
jgi:hypothetical protein